MPATTYAGEIYMSGGVIALFVGSLAFSRPPGRVLANAEARRRPRLISRRLCRMLWRRRRRARFALASTILAVPADAASARQDETTDLGGVI